MGAKTVLAAVAGDDEDRAERFADVLETVAAPSDFVAHLVHVYAEEDMEKIESMYDIDSRDSRQLGTAAGHNQAVRRVMSELADRDVEHVVHGGVGEPGTEIVELAQQIGADFVVVGGGARSPAGKALFGSTAQDVLLNAHCPVIYFR